MSDQPGHAPPGAAPPMGESPAPLEPAGASGAEPVGAEPVGEGPVGEGRGRPSGSDPALVEQRAAALEALAVRADAHAAAARAPRTRSAYATDWDHFTRWCALAGRAALPAEVTTLRLYLTDLEAVRTETGAVAYQPATLARRLAAIAAAHRDAGHPSPTPPSLRCSPESDEPGPTHRGGCAPCSSTTSAPCWPG